MTQDCRTGEAPTAGRRRTATVLAVWPFLLAPLACTPEEDPPRSSEGGAGASGLEVEPVQYTAEGTGYALLEPGAEIELWGAPQGGHWSRVGAQVRGLDSKTVRLVARWKDAESGSILVEAERTSPMVPVPGSAGWMQPDPTSMYNVAHLPLCPSDAKDGAQGVERVLEVEVTELYDDFESGVSAVKVVPRCGQAPGPLLDYCKCECGPDYLPGKCVSGFPG